MTCPKAYSHSTASEDPILPKTGRAQQQLEEQAHCRLRTGNAMRLPGS